MATIVVPDDELTIQAAITAAGTGDIIQVRAGARTENFSFSSAKTGITVTIHPSNVARSAVVNGTCTFGTNTKNNVVEKLTIWQGSPSTVVNFDVTSGDVTENNTVRNCYLWHTGAITGSPITGVIHMEGGNSIKKNIIEDCEIGNSAIAGTIGILMHGGTLGNAIRRCIIHNFTSGLPANILSGCGIVFRHQDGFSNPDFNTIQSCLIYDCKRGISSTIQNVAGRCINGNNHVEHCTFYNMSLACIDLDPFYGPQFFNNLYYQPTGAGQLISVAVTGGFLDKAVHAGRNNCYYHEDSSKTNKWHFKGTDCENFDDWITALTTDADSWDIDAFYSDPKFTDASERNFLIKEGSPCIDTGWDGDTHVHANYVSATDFDYRDISRPQRDTFDVGAYELEAFDPNNWIFNSKIYEPAVSGNYNKLVCFGEYNSQEDVFIKIEATINAGQSYITVVDEVNNIDLMNEEITISGLDLGNEPAFRVTVQSILDLGDYWDPTETITGNALSGTEIDAREIEYEEILGRAQADSKGIFRLDVPPGTYDIMYKGNGYSHEDTKRISVGLPTFLGKFGALNMVEFDQFHPFNHFLKQTNDAKSYNRLIYDIFIDESKRRNPEPAPLKMFSKWGRCYRDQSYVKNLGLMFGPTVDPTFYNPTTEQTSESQGEL